MNIGMLRLNFKVGDFQGNMEKILRLYHQAVADGAGRVAASELALLGYPPEDMLLRHDYVAQQNYALEALARHIGQTGLVIGVAADTRRQAGMPLFNSAALIWKTLPAIEDTATIPWTPMGRRMQALTCW